MYRECPSRYDTRTPSSFEQRRINQRGACFSSPPRNQLARVYPLLRVENWKIFWERAFLRGFFFDIFNCLLSYCFFSRVIRIIFEFLAIFSSILKKSSRIDLTNIIAISCGSIGKNWEAMRILSYTSTTIQGSDDKPIWRPFNRSGETFIALLFV